jgi:hypothetical protein
MFWVPSALLGALLVAVVWKATRVAAALFSLAIFIWKPLQSLLSVAAFAGIASLFA